MRDCGPDAVTNPFILPGHPPQSYPCDCPLDFPHLPIGQDYVGCPFIWLTHNRLDPSPAFLRHPCYQVAISLARVALLTGAHASQLEFARSSSGSIYRQALNVSTMVAAAIRDPNGRRGNRWNRPAATDYAYLIDKFLLPVPAGSGPVVGRLYKDLRRRRRDHRQLVVCIILSLGRHPQAVPNDLVQQILPFVAARGSAYQRAARIVENSLPPHHRHADPAAPLGAVDGEYGPTTV